MKFKSIMLYLKAKNEEHLHEEIRKNYLNDCSYIIAKGIYEFMYKNNFDSKIWTEIYKELKGIEQVKEDNRTAKQIEEDTLNLFKDIYEEEN